MLRSAYHWSVSGLLVVWESIRILGDCFLSHSKIDGILATIIGLYVFLVFPLIPRLTSDALQLNACANDEPLITMQLDGMTVPPYGSPSNYLELDNQDRIPAYWHQLRYYDIIYYGGAYLNLALLFFAPLKLMGLETFPWAPLILRTISALAGLWCLVLIYNFAKTHSGRTAGAFAATFLLLDYNFVRFATLIHPDSLMWAFCFFALIVAVTHANRGDISSLISLGIAVGFVHGAKAGGPFVLPMALTATFIGLRRFSEIQGLSWWRKCASFSGRIFVLGMSALTSLFFNSPSIFVYSYYFRTMKRAAEILTAADSPVGTTTVISWFHETGAYLGWTLSIGAVAGIAAALFDGFGRRRNVAVLLALMLLLGNFLYYALLGRYWVCLFYLIPAFGMAAFLIGKVFDNFAHWCFEFGWPGSGIAAVVGVFILVMNVSHSIAPTLPVGKDTASVLLTNPKNSTPLLVGDWAAQNIPANSKIVFDDRAYFDPARFSNQFMNGGPVRYCTLFQHRPEYIVITDYYKGWPTEKRKTQDLGKWDESYYSVRLAQDLLGREAKTRALGPTPVPYIELVAVIEPSAPDFPIQLNWCPSLFQDWLYVYQLLRDRSIRLGHRLCVFRIDPRFYEDDPLCTPVSSSSAPGSDPKNAFDRRTSSWHAGESASTAPFIGADFGPKKMRKTRTVRVSWADADAIPPQIRVEHSDDGQNWTSAGVFAVPSHERDSTFALGSNGTHRFWRIVAEGSPGGRTFGLDELFFDVHSPRNSR